MLTPPCPAAPWPERSAASCPEKNLWWGSQSLSLLSDSFIRSKRVWELAKRVFRSLYASSHKQIYYSVGSQSQSGVRMNISTGFSRFNHSIYWLWRHLLLMHFYLNRFGTVDRYEGPSWDKVFCILTRSKASLAIHHTQTAAFHFAGSFFRQGIFNCHYKHIVFVPLCALPLRRDDVEYTQLRCPEIQTSSWWHSAPWPLFAIIMYLLLRSESKSKRSRQKSQMIVFPFPHQASRLSL